MDRAQMFFNATMNLKSFPPHLVRILTAASVLVAVLGFGLGLGAGLRGQSQVELNQQMSDDDQAADQKLSATLKEIKKRNSQDVKFLHSLDESQSAWVLYRDKQLTLIFPAQDEPQAYGSSFPMCWSIWKARLTNQRINELSVWLEGIKAREVCTGSIPVK